MHLPTECVASPPSQHTSSPALTCDAPQTAARPVVSCDHRLRPDAPSFGPVRNRQGLQTHSQRTPKDAAPPVLLPTLPTRPSLRCCPLLHRPVSPRLAPRQPIPSPTRPRFSSRLAHPGVPATHCDHHAESTAREGGSGEAVVPSSAGSVRQPPPRVPRALTPLPHHRHRPPGNLSPDAQSCRT